MNAIKRFYVRIRESSSGQTMTEYVLIVTAVAVGVYAGYQRSVQRLVQRWRQSTVNCKFDALVSARASLPSY